MWNMEEIVLRLNVTFLSCRHRRPDVLAAEKHYLICEEGKVCPSTSVGMSITLISR